MASVADPTLLENSERGHYKRGIATTILKMVYEFQALPKCSSTAEALSALTWGIQSDWRDTDLLQVMWDGFAQVHFFGNAQFDWQICFGALIKAIDAYRRGDLRNVGHRTDWACGIINKGGLRPNNIPLSDERLWNLPGKDPRRLEQIAVLPTDIFPLIHKDFPPYHEWPHHP